MLPEVPVVKSKRRRDDRGQRKDRNAKNRKREGVGGEIKSSRTKRADFSVKLLFLKELKTTDNWVNICSPLSV